MNAINDYINSKRVKKYPPIIILDMPRHVGYPVWCANEIVDEFVRKKVEERDRIRKDSINRV